MNRKLRRNRGFALSEPLAAVLSIALIGVIIIGGFSAYIRTWNAITRTSDGEIFTSTLEMKIQNELEYASSVAVDQDGNVLWFISDKTGYATMFTSGSRDQAMGIKSSANPDKLTDADAEDLVDSSTSKGMYGSYESLTYDAQTHVFTITKLSAMRSSDGRVLYQLGSVRIRNVNAAPAELESSQ